MPKWVQSGKCWVHVWEKEESKTLNHPRGSRGSVLLPKRNFFFFLFLHMILFISCDILVFYGHHWLLFFLSLSQTKIKISSLVIFIKVRMVVTWRKGKGLWMEAESPRVSQGMCPLFLDLHDGRRPVNLLLSYAFVLWGFCFCVLYFMIKDLKSEANM